MSKNLINCKNKTYLLKCHVCIVHQFSMLYFLDLEHPSFVDKYDSFYRIWCEKEKLNKMLKIRPFSSKFLLLPDGLTDLRFDPKYIIHKNYEDYNNMKRNTQLFDLFWEDIIVTQVLPNLTLKDCFNFRCVSKTCLQIINMYFAKLKSLKLINKGFSPHTFNVLAITCNRLTVLNLRRCTSITDNDLIPMLMRNRKLIHLNLSQCKNLSAKCLQPVILYCNNLQTLKLGRCAWLTTGAVEALALHQCLLEDVDLSYCIAISENCILIFVKKFRHLKTLNLEGNKQVSDKCLYALAKYSTSLKLLNLSGCTDISDKGVKALATHSPKLEGLLVRGCMKVTENSLKLMRNRVHLDRRPVDTGPIPIYVQV